MDKCKFCGAELNEEFRFCPICGKEQEEPVCEETVQEACACDCGEECTCDCGEECACECVETKPKKKGWKIGLLIAAGVVVLGVLAYFLIGMLQPDGANDILYKDNYTVSDTVFDSKETQVVATLGDYQMTNSQLHVHYWNNAFNFINTYAAYGIVDTTKGLHEQQWDDKWNYQQFFLDMALDAWQELHIFCMLAKENGHQLSAEDQAELDALPQQLQEMLGEEYETVDQLLSDQVLPGITEEGYLEYVADYLFGYGYFAQLEKDLAPTDAEVEAYYDEHAAGYAENGVFKVDMKANVRHILLQPEDTTSEESWAVCLENAQALLDQWKQGEATEDSFAALAKEHSADGGSAADGGLYTDITPTTNFVPSFLSWTVNPARQAGDTDIVESDYGYHIMYYVSGAPMEAVSEPAWKVTAQKDYITEKVQEVITAAEERWPMSVNYKNIALADLSLMG